MGLFDFYTGNTTNNDGLNLIYSKENGDLLYAFNKKNGKIDGLLQIFHSVRSSGQNPNYIKTNVGLVKQEYFFIDGLPNGYFKEFDSKGNLSYYIENIKSNSFNFSSKFSIYFFLNTKLLFSDKYQINGFVNEYYTNGTLSAVKKVEENKLISSEFYYKNGQRYSYSANKGMARLNKASPIFDIFDIFDNERKDIFDNERKLNNIEQIISFQCWWWKSYFKRLYRCYRRLFNKAIELDNESKVYSSRGRMKKNLLKYNRAMQDYNIAVEKYPEDESSYFGRGELKYAMADYHGAIIDFNKCIEIKPNRIIIIDKRADCRLKIEDYIGAIEDYSMSIQNRQDKYGVDRPQSENATKILASLYHNRGIARSKIKEYDEAIEDLKIAIELDPDYEEAIQLLKSLE